MNIRKSINLTVCMTAAIFMIAAANAANVLWVDAEDPHESWQNLIEGGGFSFTLFDRNTYSLNLGDQESIDYVNTFDVIVMSGSNPNFNAVRTHGEVWNAQPTRMINLGNFLISGQYQAGSWRWTTPGNGGAVNASGVVDVLDAADPIWSGVDITGGTADIFDGNAGHLTLGGNTFLPDITAVAAQSANNDRIAIAYAAPGALYDGGAEQYFIAGMTGGQQNPVTFNAAGERIFLNSIPEPSTALAAGLAALFVLSFYRSPRRQ